MLARFKITEFISANVMSVLSMKIIKAISVKSIKNRGTLSVMLIDIEILNSNRNSARLV